MIYTPFTSANFHCASRKLSDMATKLPSLRVCVKVSSVALACLFLAPIMVPLVCAAIYVDQRNICKQKKVNLPFKEFLKELYIPKRLIRNIVNL